MNSIPRSPIGVLVALAVVAFLIVVWYATMTLTILIGAVVIAVAAYAVYILGYRIDQFLKHGL